MLANVHDGIANTATGMVYMFAVMDDRQFAAVHHHHSADRDRGPTQGPPLRETMTLLPFRTVAPRP